MEVVENHFFHLRLFGACSILFLQTCENEKELDFLFNSSQIVSTFPQMKCFHYQSFLTGLYYVSANWKEQPTSKDLNNHHTIMIANVFLFEKFPLLLSIYLLSFYLLTPLLNVDVAHTNYLTKVILRTILSVSVNPASVVVFFQLIWQIYNCLFCFSSQFVIEYLFNNYLPFPV